MVLPAAQQQTLDRAIQSHSSGKLDEAVSLIQQAVLARPDYVDAIVNLGYRLNATGRFEAALKL